MLTGSTTAVSPLRYSRAPVQTHSVRSGWGYHLAAISLLLLIVALRMTYLCQVENISLASDEAHYWDWSRHLDWCYYSKGPLVGWLIRASCYLWGADVMPAVRLPAVVCNAFMLLGIYLLVFRIFQNARLAILALAVALTLPFIHVGGLLMTIDAPYACAWTWAVYVAHCILFAPLSPGGRGVGGEGTRQHSVSQNLLWFTMGLIVAIGVLAKHNMALFVPSLGLFLLLSPAHRHELLRPGFWLMALTGAVIGGGPILWWNAQHDWVTFLHVGTQATGASTATSGIRWLGPLEFFGTQAALLMGLWFVLMVMGFVTCGARLYRAKDNTEARYNRVPQLKQQLFLTCMALPMLLICLVFSFKVRIEPNWTVTAYITGLILAGWMLWERWSSPRWRRTTYAVMGLGVGLSMMIHFSSLLYPVHAMIMPAVSPRKWDPTCRLKGWDTLASEVNKLREQQKVEPILFGSTWSYTGALAFHLPGQPTVYCLGPVTGSRYSQYDFWRPNPLHDPADFAGKDAIIVGELSPQVREAFEKIEPTRRVQAREQGLVVAEWNVTVARKLKPTGFGLTVQKY